MNELTATFAGKQEKAMNADLHCHSNASDGQLSPAEVVVRAHANGVSLLSLTDHDTLGGIEEARRAAASIGLDFLAGVEISVTWKNQGIHIVGIGVDDNHHGLREGLDIVASGRIERGRQMAASLAEAGISGAFEGALAYAKDPRTLSRSHFARYLVDIGVCKDQSSVFESYLNPGKPGYVPHREFLLEQAIEQINAAGGVAILAHPGRYRIKATELRQLVQEFRELGGKALEVVSGSQTPDYTGQMARLARDFDLKASRGSDFHAIGSSYADLGRLPPLPDGVVPVWSLFDF